MSCQTNCIPESRADDNFRQGSSSKKIKINVRSNLFDRGVQVFRKIDGMCFSKW